MGFHLEAAHHEVAIGQHEIDFRHDDALTTADNLITFRMVVKVIAAHHGMHCHLHGQAAARRERFRHARQPVAGPRGTRTRSWTSPTRCSLSSEARSYIAGILNHLPAITAVANPTVNSYKRLLPGYEAPVYIAWSPGNRSAAIRVPAKRGRSTRIELRTPDPTANPYLALACMLEAGLSGIRDALTPPEPVNRNIYDLTEAESAELGIKSLPHDLSKAIDELEADTVMQSALGRPHLHRVHPAQA